MIKNNMLKRYLIPVFVFLLTMQILPQTGNIMGKVTDIITKQPLIGVNVVIIGTTFGGATNISGEYTISNIPVGTYQLRASAIGFESQTKSDVTVISAKPAMIDFSLQETILEIDNVVVTSDFFRKPPTEISSVRSFSYEEIRRAPGGFEDVIRALSVLPGVAQADAGRNDLVVRGGAPSENLYLVDGFVVQNINHFGTQGATGGPLSYINLDFVRETSFATGGFSAIYGDKLSSVLSVNLRDGRKDKLGGKLTISASQFGLNLEGPVDSKSTFLFSARRSYLDLIFKAAGFGFVPEYYDVLGKYSYDFDPKNSLSFLLIGAFDNVRYFNDTEEKRKDNARILGSNQMQYITGFSFRHLFDNGFYTLALSRNLVDYDTAQRDTLQNPIFLNKSKEEENTLRADIIFKLSPKSEVNFGGNIRLIQFDADILLPSFRTSFGEILNITSLKDRSDFWKSDLFALYSGFYYNRWRVNVGIRGDYFNAISNKFTVSPRFSTSYLLSDVTEVSFSTGIYYQNPSYIWLIADNSNRDLKQIKVNQYILGLDQRIRNDINLKVEGFYKDYSNYPASVLRPYLVLANTGAGFAGSDDNFSAFGLETLVSEGSGYARGVELSMQKKSAGTNHYGILSLTYSESRFKALDGVERKGSYEQNWIVNLSAGYIFNEKWEASLKFRFATGRPYTPYNPDGTQSVANFNTKKFPETHSLDIRIDRRWNFNNWTLITYIDIQNIYNRNNSSTIRWDYEKMQVAESSSIGILPSIGISLEI
ncbi:MAG TPA: TonB-dependent receptor [Ignavibacteriaceae bacterium]|nr:TonB-dependent receptor [Ignavibacteriaceae bacterium]